MDKALSLAWYVDEYGYLCVSLEDRGRLVGVYALQSRLDTQSGEVKARLQGDRIVLDEPIADAPNEPEDR